jgi:TIR domain
MAEVFINYRTKDGDEAAEHINSYLSGRFGKEHVFKASHSLRPGDQYPQALLDAARQSDVLLAVMGPEWSSASQLEDEADWVRQEILAASSSDGRVVPVLKGRQTGRLARTSLPPELKWLADVHSLRLDMHQSDLDLKAIGDLLAELVPTLKAAELAAGRSAPSGANDNSAADNSGNLVQGRDIHGGVHNTSVTGGHGPAVVGDGNTQNNFLADFGARLRIPRARQQPIDQLRWLQRRFIRPAGFDGAAAILEQHGTVIIDGPPGSGRCATAQMLLFAACPEKGRLHELTQEADKESDFRLNPDYVGPDDRIWVDLSDAGRQLWEQCQQDLHVLRTRVIAFNARLVVIMPYREDLRPEFRDYLKHIGAPSPLDAFYHLLRAEALLQPDVQVDPPKFLTGTRSMADIRQFVDDVLDAKSQSDGQGGIGSWIAAASETTAPRERAVAESVTRLQQTPQRALLLCTAMLHGAHADVIDRRTTALLANLEYQPRAALDDPPLDQRLRDVGAKADAGRHVHFLSSGYEVPVRAFFWRHFPELHEPLAAWVRATLDSNYLTDHDRDVLARGFTELCLDRRYQPFWKGLVEHLTSGRGNQTNMWVAATILEYGLRDETDSRTFRRQIYDWSLDDRTPILAEVLVAACEAMPYTHRDEALVRLHHIARRYPPRVGARDALAELARSDPWLLRVLLSRVTRKSPDAAWAADAGIFLDVAVAAHFTSHSPTGRPLTEQIEVIRQLADGWALAFTREPRENWLHRAHDWLHSAADDGVNRNMLVDVLVDGARAVPGVLPQLYGIVNRATFREAIADLVLAKISAAYGVELR